MASDASSGSSSLAPRSRRPRRRGFRDAGPFYAPLLDGLPEAIHETLIEAADLRDAVAWLQAGVPLPPLDTVPPSGERFFVPERYLVQAVGVGPDRVRWVHFSRWKWRAPEFKDLSDCEWYSDFEGFECRSSLVRAQLHTTGARNARRYHVWFGADDSVDLFEYADPVPVYEIGPDDPPRRRLPTTAAQDAVLRFMGS